MKPFPRPSAGFCRQCLSFTRRSYTTSPPSPAALSALTARPPKLIPDYLTPMPSHLLTTTLSDLLSAPQTSTPLITRPHPIALPQGHHLVYFPIQTPPSQLAPDGADLDHSPGGQFVRRVWAGGEVRFRGRGLRLDCREALCREVVRDVVVKGEGEGMKVFVDVVREYGRGHEGEREEWDIEEVRTLVFMPPREVSDAPAQPKLIKGMHIYSPHHSPSTDHPPSPLQTNAQSHNHPPSPPPLPLLRPLLQRTPHPHRSQVRPLRRPSSAFSPRPAHARPHAARAG